MHRRSFVSALAVAGVIAMADAPTARSAPPRTGPTSGPPPNAKNVVLVHGAYADGSCWADVIPYLQARGMNVASVQNPLRTLDEDVQFAQRTLALMDGPTVLVGHSYSGMIVTQVGVDPRVASLVYIAARAPDAGEDYTALAKKFPTPPASRGLIKGPDGYAQLSEEAFLQDFAQDVDPRLVESVAAAVNRHVPWLPGAYELLVNLAWASVPCALVTMAYSPVARVVAAAAPPKSLQVVLAGNDVGRGKPHPDPYLEAARRLGVDPKKCVAIEDSLNGTLSAESAGISVLVVPGAVKVPPGPRRHFTQSLSAVTLENLSDISRRNNVSS